MTTRAELIEAIQQLPEEMTAAEIVEALQIRFQIEDGLRELDDGKGMPHDQAIVRAAKRAG